jgi:hypothetical protein
MQQAMKDAQRIVLIVLGTMVATICFVIVFSAIPYPTDSLLK